MENEQVEKVNIFENSVAVGITIGKIGVARKVSAERVDVKDQEGEKDEVSKDQIKVQKHILKCKEFDAINSLDNEVRIKLGKLALPAPFRRGVYLVPLALLEKVDNLFGKYRASRDEAVKTFVDCYVQRKIEAKDKLGSLYCEEDYPLPISVAASFYTRINYLSLGVPDALKDLSPELFRRERDKFEAELEDAADEIKSALREGFGLLVSSMADKLRDSPDGSRQIFRDSLVKNMGEFLEIFDARNIAKDGDLAKLVSSARDLLGGVSPSELRDNKETRLEIQKGFAAIAGELETIKVPRRKFNLDEE